MTINKDLFLAILSMDSYNRGYGQGISGLAESDSIGNAILTRRTEIFGSNSDAVFQKWQSAGFYALAYDLTGAGIAGLTGTVISYRGSDDNLTIRFVRLWAQ
jgi:hypothetical protein